MVQKKIDLRARFGRIHALQFMDSTTLKNKKSRDQGRQHAPSHPRKAKHRRRGDSILTRDHRAYPNARIDLDKRAMGGQQATELCQVRRRLDRTAANRGARRGHVVARVGRCHRSR